MAAVRNLYLIFRLFAISKENLAHISVGTHKSYVEYFNVGC
jgi:hypothetical protein